MTTESHLSAGELLKQGRLRQRLSLAECAKRTHISVRYLEALEEEHWSHLPSESHRLGFIRLYSRFLGVSAEEVLALYRKKAMAGVPMTSESASFAANEKSIRVTRADSSRSEWSLSSIPQLIGLAILLLVLAWVVFHAVSPYLSETNPMPWTRNRTPTQSRLVTPKTVVAVHKVRIKADADSWLRVTSSQQLLFEGILPARAVKEWAGAGPYQFKIGNIRAVSLFWNDQPVDLHTGARGSINEIRIPPQ